MIFHNSYELRSVDVNARQAVYRQFPSGNVQILNLPSEDCAKRLKVWLESRDQCIQDAVPELSTDDRERCLSGMEPDDWDRITLDPEELGEE